MFVLSRRVFSLQSFLPVILYVRQSFTGNCEFFCRGLLGFFGVDVENDDLSLQNGTEKGSTDALFAFHSDLE